MYLAYLEQPDQLWCSMWAFAVRPLSHPLAAEVCSHTCIWYRQHGALLALGSDSHMSSYRKIIGESLHIRMKTISIFNFNQNQSLTIVVRLHQHEVVEFQNRIYIVYHRLVAAVVDRLLAIDQEGY